MTPNDIVNLVIAIVSIIPTIVSAVALIINIIKTKNWKLVTTIADSVMESVESYAKTHPGMSSDDKLNMAIEGIKSGLATAGISLDEAALKRVIDYVKESIKWFNGMQGRESK